MTASTSTANAPALHPVPERGAIVREQIDSVSIAIRNERLVFLGALVVFLLLGIYSAVRGNGGHGGGHFDYGPQATIPMTIIALLIPFGVWRGSDRDRRAYDWTMPIAQGSHTIIRALSGWMWLMLGVAAYLVFLIVLEFSMTAIAGGSLTIDVPAWQWLVPFTATSMAYLLTSIAIIGSEHPWRWIGGIVAGYLLALFVLDMAKLPDINQALQQLVSGYYGLAAAIFGDVGSRVFGTTYHETAGIDRWLGATLIWGALSVAGVWLAARRHSTS